MLSAIRQGLAGLAAPNRGAPWNVLGFAVRIHWSFWLIACVIGLQRGASLAGLVGWVAVVLVSILVHELGHAFTAQRWGVVQGISVHGGGGETTWRPLGGMKWWQRLAVSLAGPAAGFGLAFVGWLAEAYLPRHGAIGLLAFYLVQVNVFWGLFNLLPIAPLDGGQALRAWLAGWWYERGEWVAAGIGVLTAGAVLVAAILIGQTWAAIVMGIYGIHNAEVLRGHYQAYRSARSQTQWRRPSDRDQTRERY